MSLNTLMDQHDTNKLPQLRTADQFQAWRVRVADKCWALTGKDVFLVQNSACVTAIKAVNDEKDYDKRDNWVGKCWLTITGALHDDLLVKVAHVERGMINLAEDVSPIRLELYGATMQKEGNSDLQTYIAYILERQRKLLFLKKPVDDTQSLFPFFSRVYTLYFNRCKCILAFQTLCLPNSTK
jgi:hypothetical protein